MSEVVSGCYVEHNSHSQPHHEKCASGNRVSDIDIVDALRRHSNHQNVGNRWIDVSTVAADEITRLRLAATQARDAERKQVLSEVADAMQRISHPMRHSEYSQIVRNVAWAE